MSVDPIYQQWLTKSNACEDGEPFPHTVMYDVVVAVRWTIPVPSNKLFNAQVGWQVAGVYMR